MENVYLKREILNGSCILRKQLAKLGLDQHNTKKDLVLLSFLDEIIDKHKEAPFIDKCGLDILHRMLNCIRDNNPILGYCRKDRHETFQWMA